MAFLMRCKSQDIIPKGLSKNTPYNSRVLFSIPDNGQVQKPNNPKCHMLHEDCVHLWLYNSCALGGVILIKFYIYIFH
jgi:hypothetical protein